MECDCTVILNPAVYILSLTDHEIHKQNIPYQASIEVLRRLSLKAVRFFVQVWFVVCTFADVCTGDLSPILNARAITPKMTRSIMDRDCKVKSAM